MGRASLVVPLVALCAASPAVGQMVQVTSSSSTEAKLVAIDHKSPVVPQSEITYYGHLLDRLNAKCRENRSFIGDIAVKGTQLLKENKGVTLSIGRFLELMDEANPDEDRTLNLKCADIAAFLVVTTDRP